MWIFINVIDVDSSVSVTFEATFIISVSRVYIVYDIFLFMIFDSIVFVGMYVKIYVIFLMMFLFMMYALRSSMFMAMF